jgi:glycosyltransferase involved in cell wall biosynthesis
MRATPEVSAVIPVYNGERYVAEAIRSALGQSLPPVECIVVDDGSTDASAEVAMSFGEAVTYVHQENGGVSLARNRGAACARGEVVAFLDHDDVWLPDKLERQLALLCDSGAALVTCATILVTADGITVGERRLRPVRDLPTGMLMFDGTEVPSCSSTGAIWKSEFHLLGGFDLRLGTSADWDLLFHVAIRGRLAYLDEPLVKYRLHAGSMSRSVPATERDMLYAYHKAFADPTLPAALVSSRRHAYARLYRMLSGSYLQAGDTRNALRAALASAVRDPWPIARSGVGLVSKARSR